MGFIQGSNRSRGVLVPGVAARSSGESCGWSDKATHRVREGFEKKDLLSRNGNYLDAIVFVCVCVCVCVFFVLVGLRRGVLNDVFFSVTFWRMKVQSVLQVHFPKTPTLPPWLKYPPGFTMT